MTTSEGIVSADEWTSGDDPEQSGRQFLDARINEFNMAVTGIHEFEPVAFFARDDAGAIVAGLSGWIWDDCLHVDLLWVREDRRGRGYGTRLMERAEDVGRGRGCREVMLETHSFQAPAFYRRRGYEIAAVLDDYPMGHQKFVLRKQLS